MSTATLEAPKNNTVAKDNRPLRKFRLLASLHWDDEGKLHDARDKDTMYVESTRDLSAEFGRDKFVEVHQHEPVAAPVIKYVPMEAMSLTDLQNFAKDENIDLKSAKTKPEVLKVIQAALNT